MLYTSFCIPACSWSEFIVICVIHLAEPPACSMHFKCHPRRDMLTIFETCRDKKTVSSRQPGMLIIALLLFWLPVIGNRWLVSWVKKSGIARRPWRRLPAIRSADCCCVRGDNDRYCRVRSHCRYDRGILALGLVVPLLLDALIAGIFA